MSNWKKKPSSYKAKGCFKPSEPIIAALMQKAENGALVADLVAEGIANRDRGLAVANLLVRDGKLFMSRPKSNGPAYFWLTKQAAEAHMELAKGVAPPVRTQGPTRARWSADEAPVNAVKVTQCPGFTGNRYTPAPGHVGIFSLAGIGRYIEG